MIAGNTGFLLNDEMDDFTVQPGVANHYGLMQGEANAIAPGKRPLSSMAPTLVLRDGHVFLVLGSPGGPRIITIIMETALNILDYGMAPQEAVDAPRLHHQWLPDEIVAEPFALSPDTQVCCRRWATGSRSKSPGGRRSSSRWGRREPRARPRGIVRRRRHGIGHAAARIYTAPMTRAGRPARQSAIRAAPGNRKGRVADAA